MLHRHSRVCVFSILNVLSPQITICMFVLSQSLAQSLSELLSSDRYILYSTASESELFSFVEQHKQFLDCLVLQSDNSLQPYINRWSEQGILLPVVIFPKESEKISNVAQSNSLDSQITEEMTKPANYLLHAAEVRLNIKQVHEIGVFIDEAIAQFVSLAPTSLPSVADSRTAHLTKFSFLMQQQRRLAEKLRERLGYLGVYYKRNPQLFLRHLSASERQKLLDNLKSEYRQIVLKYFAQENTLNQKIDNFVDTAFFADISVSRIVEIHMEVMEEFSKQLKLEGRSEEVLLDYRLTLIDVIAHLGEMYRRSIPRESPS
jgi:circadian clock protein KaiA